jgi:two-component system CheB/CheR fusion protein
MEVTEAQDSMPIQGAKVYVIPPNALMFVRAGILRLLPAPARPVVPMPIDHFMCSLAEEMADRAVGIVLSGTEHDGTAGLQAIQAAGGLTIAQRPEGAQFPGMPQSAIAAGGVDLVLPVEEMPHALLDYAMGEEGRRGPPWRAKHSSDASGAEADSLRAILAMVQARTGHDFAWYRPAMLHRRLARRMAVVGAHDPAEYLAHVQRSPDEIDALTKDFLISVTSFFRDPEAWEALEREVLPALTEGGGSLTGSFEFGRPDALPGRKAIPSRCCCSNAWAALPAPGA